MAAPDLDAARAAVGLAAFTDDHGGKVEGRAIDTIGYRGMHSYEVAFDGWFVPDDHLVGGEAGLRRGFYLTMGGFENGRLQTAARAVGVMQAAYEAAVEYAGNRVIFGRPAGGSVPQATQVNCRFVSPTQPGVPGSEPTYEQLASMALAGAVAAATGRTESLQLRPVFVCVSGFGVFGPTPPPKNPRFLPEACTTNAIDLLPCGQCPPYCLVLNVIPCPWAAGPAARSAHEHR